MRVRDNGGTDVGRNISPAGSRDAAAGPAAERAATAAARLADVATIMGVPEVELTPKVRGAIDRLMSEVQRLREELGRAKRRIGFLEGLADQDPLAPVLNRRAFVRELARMIAFAERYETPGSVLYFDIDGMKRINDAHGHAAGDAALKRVAEVLLGEVRASDAVGRLGGDEFGVLLAQAGAEMAGAKAASLAAAVTSDPVVRDGAPLDVGVSYGIYTFAGGEAVEDALHAADQAMYAQKQGHGLARAKA
ncbi:MAG: GGDEF domain-containing protein [Kiloniellales bacterium]